EQVAGGDTNDLAPGEAAQGAELVLRVGPGLQAAAETFLQLVARAEVRDRLVVVELADELGDAVEVLAEQAAGSEQIGQSLADDRPLGEGGDQLGVVGEAGGEQPHLVE